MKQMEQILQKLLGKRVPVEKRLPVYVIQTGVLQERVYECVWCGKNFGNTMSRQIMQAHLYLDCQSYPGSVLLKELRAENLAILKNPFAVELNILRRMIILPDYYVSKRDTNGEWAKMQAENERLKTWQYETAKEMLLTLMEDFSEEAWCAGWMDGLDSACKAIVAGKKDSYGMIGMADKKHLDPWKKKLTELHDLCGGWWEWRGEGHGAGPVFVKDKEG